MGREMCLKRVPNTYNTHNTCGVCSKSTFLFLFPTSLPSYYFSFFKGRKIAMDSGKVKLGELRIGTAFRLFLLISVTTNVRYVETAICRG